MVHASHPTVVELRACGPGDLNGDRAGAILGAYFDAEHARACRRLLWQRLALVLLAWAGLSMTLHSMDMLVAGTAIVGCAAAYAIAFEWRAGLRLQRRLAEHRTR